jgi:hypothetical protein
MWKAYAELPSLRWRQQVADVALLVWVTAWTLAGRGLYRTVESLRGATASARDAGAGFAARLDGVARLVDGVPVVGASLRRPFVGAADAGRTLQSAGEAAGATVHTLALWAGFLVALVPIAWWAARYVPGRLRWMREAGAAASLRLDAEDLRLFALRAVANAPLHVLRAACADPAAALDRGDVLPLAAIELRRLGLALPATAAAATERR